MTDGLEDARTFATWALLGGTLGLAPALVAVTSGWPALGPYAAGLLVSLGTTAAIQHWWSKPHD